MAVVDHYYDDHHVFLIKWCPQ